MRRPEGTAAFYVLLATQSVSLIGSQTNGLAVGIAVFRLTGHATPLALVSVFWAIPRVLLGGLGGALADRIDRRTLMLAANIGYAVGSALLWLAFRSGAFHVWELYGLTLVNSTFGAVETPALQASVAMLVPDRHRDRANAIQQLSYPGAVIVAAAFAGLLYATVGVAGAIEVDLGTFAVGIGALLVLRIPMPPADPNTSRPGLWRQSFDGFRYLARRPGLLALCIYIALVSATAGGFFWAVMTPYLLDRVHSTATFGAVFAIGFSGAIGGALTMAAWGGTRPRIHTVMVSTLLAGAAMTLIGVARTPLTLGAALFVLTFVIPFVNAALSSIFQGEVAPDLQGRVFAAMAADRPAQSSGQRQRRTARRPRVRARREPTRMGGGRVGRGRHAGCRDRPDVRPRRPLARGADARRLRHPGSAPRGGRYGAGSLGAAAAGFSAAPDPSSFCDAIWRRGGFPGLWRGSI
jgi:MFS family permease